MSKWARQRDANEPQIVTALKDVGATVAKLDGKGLPDLLVGYKGDTFLMEVKGITKTGKTKRTRAGQSLSSEAPTDARGLLDSQQKWWAAWTGKPPVVVRTPEEALRAIGLEPVTVVWNPDTDKKAGTP